eukprot:gnl/TRDRNA2_/TRDRNA2_41701_c0_seq1.p1 gnl/TRDRNA2_/TRDRNA2_41701_c0~~gnl/TRDRNA2_/TRDRNA2_41701_c0_seq1.p1  ORF type:complete len:483 (+),score=83.78 gnl/TRDRNA2_/TRDRNA2_41701_c0_seq1:57-1451(+)
MAGGGESTPGRGGASTPGRSGTNSSGFVDYYELLGCDPDTPQEELKKIHFEKIREFHPDKRPGSAGGTGAKVTGELNQGWEILREPESRKLYDERWRQEKEASLPPHQRADIYRRKGNDLYVEARDMAKAAEGKALDFSALQRSLKKYQEAIDLYSKAIGLAAYDHRCFSNRALCYQALEDWKRCKEDAQQCTKLKPDFMKGWFLGAKALWKLGDQKEARLEIENGLKVLPKCKELLDLQAEFAGEVVENRGRAHVTSRSVSPAVTPPPSSRTLGGTVGQPCGTDSATLQHSFGGPGGQTTPPRASGSTTPPRKSPSLAGAAMAGQGFTAAANAAGLSQSLGPRSGKSRSPGPRSNSKSPGPSGHGGHPFRAGAPHLESTAGGQSLHTGNFGVATPAFQNAPNTTSPWGQTGGNSKLSQSRGNSHSPGPPLGPAPTGQQAAECSFSNTAKEFTYGTRGNTPPRR